MNKKPAGKRKKGKPEPRKTAKTLPEPSSETSEFLARMMREGAANQAFEDKWKMSSLDGVATDDDLFRAFETLRDYIHEAADPRYVLERWEYMVDREKVAGLLPVSQPGNHARIPLPENCDLNAELTSCVWRRVQPAVTVLEEMMSSRVELPLMLSRLSWLEERLLPSSLKSRISTVRPVPCKSSVFANTEYRLRRALRRIAAEPRPQNDASASRLKWKSSINAFAFIFNELADKGYIERPLRGGKKGGPNRTGYLKVLLQAIEVVGEDGSPSSAENLRVPMSDGFHRPLAEKKAEKFTIPPARELVIPEAKDIAE